MADAPKSQSKPAQTDPPQPILQTDTPVADPLRPRSGMTPAEAMNASPNHLLEPDPLPALDRSIVTPPQFAMLHTPSLHVGQASPHVEAAVEELRTRLGEIREFLKRFPHVIGGDLGVMVDYMRSAFGIPRPDPVRDADRQTEDAHTASRRRAEDAVGSPSPERVQRRAEEDAGLAALRRIQDTSP